MTIKAVVLDFGGVYTASPFTGLRSWHEERGLDAAVGLRIVFGPYDQDTDHPWHRVERGELAIAAAAEQIKAIAAEEGLELDLFELFSAMGGEGGARSDVVDLTLALRAEGYRTALITNNVAEFADGWRAMIPVEDLFEVVVDSSAVGMRKPDPAIFRATLDQLGLAPHEAVFLDDAPGNVRAAEALGMRAILVEDDHGPAFAALRRLLDDEGLQNKNLTS
ncbi:MAG: HAD family phosphatase [Acidimicrobiales bacterium]|nr:HAD family phosphatase [Acidimicrobiales bacterium]